MDSKKFVEGHNHERTLSRYVHLFPAHRGMADPKNVQVDNVQSYGIRTYHIMVLELYWF